MEEQPKIKLRRGPWERHLELRDAGGVMSLTNVIAIAENLEITKSIEYAAIFVLTYLTGSRITEILPGRLPRIREGTKEKYHIDVPGLRVKDITVINQKISDDKEVEFLCIVTRVLKTREKYLKEHPEYIYKRMLIPIEGLYKPLCEIVFKFSDWFSRLHFGRETPDTQLFNNVKKNSFRIYIAKQYNISLQYIRHVRTSHLVSIHRISESELRDVMRWVPKSQMMTRYIHPSQETVTIKMVQFQDDYT